MKSMPRFLTFPGPNQRFSSPISVDETAKLLEYTYRQIVSARAKKGGVTDIGQISREYLRKVAVWLCDNTKKDSLLLCGGIGNGKTTTAETICAVENSINNCKYWVTAVTAENISQKSREELAQLSKIRYLYLDDVGTEPLISQDFGNKIAPFAYLISERYPNRLPTIITSNISLDDIGKRYGERIRDRLVEMCEVLVFESKSYRR